jgi:predicted NBD/HSP70 family sugar kinase
METSHTPDFKQREVPRNEPSRKGFFTYHALSDKEIKNLSILELIRKKGPITRSDISKITDINLVSISNYIKDYINKKLVLEKGVEVSSGGRRPELVELNKEDFYVMGVDIGQQEIIATLTDLGINVMAKEKTPKPEGNLEEVGDETVKLIQELVKKSKVSFEKINSTGIGISEAALLSIKDKLKEKLGIETFVGNDAACAAFGEKKLNPQADVEDLLYMHSEVGCGIIVKGDIYFGAGGNAGGMQVSEELKEAKYLKPWGIDLGITQAAKNEVKKGIGTSIVNLAKGDVSNITKDVVIEAARQNDEIALDIIEMAGMNLGVRIAYLVNLFNPEVVVIGGGIERAGELILDPIIKMVKKLAFAEQARIVKIIPSALGEDAVSLGAASLAVREIFLKA